jgi:hypothetical protein
MRKDKIDIEIGDLVRYAPPQSRRTPVVGVVVDISHSETVFPHFIIMVKWQKPIPGWGIRDGWYPYGDGFIEVTKI